MLLHVQMPLFRQAYMYMLCCSCFFFHSIDKNLETVLRYKQSLLLYEKQNIPYKKFILHIMYMYK